MIRSFFVTSQNRYIVFNHLWDRWKIAIKTEKQTNHFHYQKVVIWFLELFMSGMPATFAIKSNKADNRFFHCNILWSKATHIFFLLSKIIIFIFTHHVIYIYIYNAFLQVYFVKITFSCSYKGWLWWNWWFIWWQQMNKNIY